MEPPSFPSRHHMLRQQELSKCHPLDTLFKMQQNDKNKEDNVAVSVRILQNLENNKRLLGDKAQWEKVGSTFPARACDCCPGYFSETRQMPQVSFQSQ